MSLLHHRFYFYSLAGATYYAHGDCRYMSSFTRQLIALLADTLFLTIAFQLARALTCVEVDGTVVLLTDPSVICWQVLA